MLALAMGGFAVGTTEFAAMSLLPYFARELRIDEPTAGHVISAYALGVVVGAPLIAVLGAKLSRRTLLILLMIMFAAGNGLSAVVPNYGWLVLFRFIAGLPHGACFGIAALVASGLVPPDQRVKAVGRVILGVTLATVVGVPTATWIGQAIGWRSGFAIVSCLALTTIAMLTVYAPRDVSDTKASPLRELSALGKLQVWLTLLIGAVGFVGLFAVYTYMATTLVKVTHVTPGFVPVVLMIFGVGMTIGNMVVPWFADKALMPTAGALLLFAALLLILFPLAAPHVGWTMVDSFLLGTSVALGTVLQARLMDVAGDAQVLAAALNHSAFNTANALGPFLGGLAIKAGFGWTSTGPVGAALALGGFLVWTIAMLDDRRRTRKAETLSA